MKLRELEKELGKNVNLGIKPGEKIVHPLRNINTEVIKVFKDRSNNDVFIQLIQLLI